MTDNTANSVLDPYKRRFQRRPAAYAFWCHLSSSLFIAALILSPILLLPLFFYPAAIALYGFGVILFIGEAVAVARTYSKEDTATEIPDNWNIPLTAELKKIYQDHRASYPKRVCLTIFVPTRYFYRPRFGLFGTTTRICNISNDLLCMLSSAEFLVLAELEVRMGSRFRSLLGTGLFERYQRWGDIVLHSNKNPFVAPIHEFWNWIQRRWASVLESCVFDSFAEIAQRDHELLVSAICRRKLSEHLQEALWLEYVSSVNDPEARSYDRWLETLQESLNPSKIRTIILGWLHSPVIPSLKEPTYYQAFLHIGLREHELENMLVEMSRPSSFPASEILLGDRFSFVMDSFEDLTIELTGSAWENFSATATEIAGLVPEEASRFELYSVLKLADWMGDPDFANRAYDELIRRDSSDAVTHYCKGLLMAAERSHRAFHEFDYCYKRADFRRGAAQTCYDLATVLGEEQLADQYLELTRHAEQQWPSIQRDALDYSTWSCMTALSLESRDVDYLVRKCRSCLHIKSAFSVRYTSRVDPTAYFDYLIFVPAYAIFSTQSQYAKVALVARSMDGASILIPKPNGITRVENCLNKIAGAKIYDRG